MSLSSHVSSRACRAALVPSSPSPLRSPSPSSPPARAPAPPPAARAAPRRRRSSTCRSATRTPPASSRAPATTPTASPTSWSTSSHAAGTACSSRTSAAPVRRPTSILNDAGLQAPSAPAASTTPTNPRLAAAEDYLRTHRGEVALITVSIGGNDITDCVTQADPVGCVTRRGQTITTNVGRSCTPPRRCRSRRPDRRHDLPRRHPRRMGHQQPHAAALAKQSVLAFQLLINPALKTAYESVGAPSSTSPRPAAPTGRSTR